VPDTQSQAGCSMSSLRDRTKPTEPKTNNVQNYAIIIKPGGNGEFSLWCFETGRDMSRHRLSLVQVAVVPPFIVKATGNTDIRRGYCGEV
jgi:hypothetical protein